MTHHLERRLEERHAQLGRAARVYRPLEEALRKAEPADLALSTMDSAYDAWNGQSVYKDVGKVPGCAIAVLYDSFVHLIALKDSGITLALLEHPDGVDERLEVELETLAVGAAAERIGCPVIVQPMIKGGVELLAGVAQDPVFGPLVAFGPRMIGKPTQITGTPLLLRAAIVSSMRRE